MREPSADGAAANRTLEFVFDEQTARAVGEPLRDYAYDPRKRPWWGRPLPLTRRAPSKNTG